MGECRGCNAKWKWLPNHETLREISICGLTSPFSRRTLIFHYEFRTRCPLLVDVQRTQTLSIAGWRNLVSHASKQYTTAMSSIFQPNSYTTLTAFTLQEKWWLFAAVDSCLFESSSTSLMTFAFFCIWKTISTTPDICVQWVCALLDRPQPLHNWQLGCARPR